MYLDPLARRGHARMQPVCYAHLQGANSEVTLELESSQSNGLNPETKGLTARILGTLEVQSLNLVLAM